MVLRLRLKFNITSRARRPSPVSRAIIVCVPNSRTSRFASPSWPRMRAAKSLGFTAASFGNAGVPISTFTSSDGSAPAKIEILAVTLHDANDGSEVDQLEASNPQKWSTSGGYSAWDQTIAPKSELKASYTLSSPAWSTMSDTSYSRKFRLRVTVKVDGTQVVLQSAILSREPAVAT